MDGLSPLLAGGSAIWARCWPSTLFGRLASLLFVAVLLSHVLALTLLFELAPPPGPPPGVPPLAGLPGHAPPPSRPGPPLMHPGMWLDIGVRLGALMLAAWIGARWLSQPMRRLARAAGELGRDIHRAPLAEEGTQECREATRVFNQMQAQIRQQLEDRDRFVAAVSHDLRTPLTRLRLRAETLSDASQRHDFSQDIQEMDAMIRATLDYLCGTAAPEPWVALDLEALLRSMVDDGLACGQNVQWVEGHAAPIRARALALRRCIGNLMENAVRYGGCARIRLRDSADHVQIEISDTGPGIPEAELGKVLAPFYRVEGSRNRHTGGLGLGLSIAQDIAQQHQGRLHLGNAVGGGLVVTLELPRQPG